MAAKRYFFGKEHVITKSDSSAGYVTEKFRDAFSQSEHPVTRSLDAYHVCRNLNRVFDIR
ncbi:MAG: hypothetical protein C6P37_13290 [Caldibacillus debilis]|uniref:Uncharacterized protein n=1 Tax=Caldibacillus debilis TaxID=301148 RepID=A0A3E0K282_9BACI|nr:MAG: hypothetical protein C6P37_13290 [Caldibacillus debilis]